MNDIKLDELYRIVADFRAAIVAAKMDGKFGSNDTMSLFPRGCCELSCDLLAYYLFDQYSIKTDRYNGLYDDDIPENITNHEWLTYKNTIIDITYSQFRFVTGSKEETFFGVDNGFYGSLERVKKHPFYDIRKNKRLFFDYKIICEYLP